MKAFLDTNVLVAAVIQIHESHHKAFAVLDRVQNGKDHGFVSAHSLAEIYSVLTRLPQNQRHSPEQALLSIEENVLKYFKIVSLSGMDYAALLREAAVAGVAGGTIYDAVLLKAAEKSGAEKIYTFNVRHFQSIAPEKLFPLILAP
ncbi:MAG TPA: PIN domain-containing protein [Verrucomicrobiae bacterium]|jgi:predicted nucleic acid-binding protein|nr:PIN domain-containing protein [Verrucomicrobiae bacterium]